MRYNILLCLFILTGCFEKEICLGKYEYADIISIQNYNNKNTFLLFKKGNDPEQVYCELNYNYIPNSLVIEGPLYGKKL